MASAIELDGTNSIVIEPTADGWPPLMFLFRDGLSVEEAEQLRDTFKDGGKGHQPLLLIGDEIRVYQLVDGRWQGLS